MTVENPYAGQGAVLLDIGGDVGALVVFMPASLEGVEVEIRPAGGPSGHDHDHHHGDDHQHDHHHDHGPVGHLPHVAVVARPVGSTKVPSLVFGELVEGSYELYQRPAGPVELTVSVVGGQVTEVSWPTGA